MKAFFHCQPWLSLVAWSRSIEPARLPIHYYPAGCIVRPGVGASGSAGCPCSHSWTTHEPWWSVNPRVSRR